MASNSYWVFISFHSRRNSCSQQEICCSLLQINLLCAKLETFFGSKGLTAISLKKSHPLNRCQCIELILAFTSFEVKFISVNLYVSWLSNFEFTVFVFKPNQLALTPFGFPVEVWSNFLWSNFATCINATELKNLTSFFTHLVLYIFSSGVFAEADFWRKMFEALIFFIYTSVFQETASHWNRGSLNSVLWIPTILLKLENLSPSPSKINLPCVPTSARSCANFSRISSLILRK